LPAAASSPSDDSTSIPFRGSQRKYAELAAALGRIGLTCLHMVDHSSMGAPKKVL
jgi:hypothetical protein